MFSVSNEFIYQSKYSGLIQLRSGLEVRVARILDLLCDRHIYRSWSYEKFSFKYKDTKGYNHNYVPDFRVIDQLGKIFFIESKGFFKRNDYNKIKSMKLRGIDIYLLMNDDVTKWERDLLIKRA